MTRVANDRRAGSRASGFGLAALSAASFGLSGSLAAGLMAAGWSPSAAVAARVLVAAAALAWPACRAGRRAWPALRRDRAVGRGLAVVVGYGLVAVAGCQLCYFYAVSRLDVGVALLIEYTAPVAVVGWLWLRRGERPSRLTAAGGVVAAAGLVLVLNLISGAHVDLIGVLWSLGAMVGAALYFVVSGDGSTGVPAVVLAAGGLVVAAVTLMLAGLSGLLPMRVTTAPVHLAGGGAPWWLPVLGLGVVTAAIAYSAGIAAARRLGSRLASFVALGEVLAALVFAWALLSQAPAPIQLLGAVLVVAGIVLVRLGEPAAERGAAVEPADAMVR